MRQKSNNLLGFARQGVGKREGEVAPRTSRNEDQERVDFDSNRSACLEFCGVHQKKGKKRAKVCRVKEKSINNMSISIIKLSCSDLNQAPPFRSDTGSLIGSRGHVGQLD